MDLACDRRWGQAYIDELFEQDIRKWLGRLVASQKCLINFSDKENKHNRALLGIQGWHSKLALAGRSVDQREEDKLLKFIPYTLEDYGFTVMKVPCDPSGNWEV